MARSAGKIRIIGQTFKMLLGVQVLLAAFSGLNGLVDNLFASNYIGHIAVSTIGLYAPVNSLISIIGIAYRNSSQVLSGRLMGNNQISRTKSIFTADIISVTILGLIIWAIMFFLTEPLSHLLLAKQAGILSLQQYLKALSFGALPLLLGIQFASFLSLERRLLVVNLTTGAMIATNAIMNYILICRMHMGITGLALATVISYWAFALGLMLFYLSSSAVIRFDFKVLAGKDFRQLLNGCTGYVIYSVYVAVQGLFINWMIMKTAGEEGVASYTIANTIMAIAMALPSGILTVCRLLFSIYITEEDKKSIIEVFRFLMTRVMLLVLAVSAVIVLAAEPLTSFFYNDPGSNVYHMTVTILRIWPWALPLITLAWVYSSYAGIIGRSTLGNIITITEAVAGMIIFCPILVYHFGTTGIWLSTVMPGIASAVILGGFIAYKSTHKPMDMEDFSTIPEGFGVPDSDRLDITVRSIEEVTETAELVQLFCRKKGIEGKRSYYAALCLEEMAANIVLHGFNKDNKEHAVDIRVTHKDDELVLRLTDNCIPFDPSEKQDIMDPANPLQNIGIRVVYNLSKDMSYHNVFGLNVLTITI